MARHLGKLIGLLAIAAATSSAAAYSGAEFLHSNDQFSRGYAWAALEYQTTIGNAETVDRMDRTEKCIRDAGIDSELFHSAVRAYIQGNLASMTEPAVVAVLRTSLEMCPWEPD